MGGMVVQKYLESYPAAAVILMASAPPHGLLGTTARFFQFKGLVPSMLRRDILSGLKKNIRAAFYGSEISPELLQEFEDQLCAESFKAYLALVKPKIKINYHTKIPMLVMAAQHDRLISVKDGIRTAQKYGATFMMVPRIAHNMMLDTGHERPAKEILAWLNEI